MKKHLPLEHRIKNAQASQEIERLHAIHQFTVANGRYREEFAAIWDMSDDCAWGFNWGTTIGWREVWYSNIAFILNQVSWDYDTNIAKVYPETAGREAQHLCFWEYNELNSGVVEVADDGKTGRAAWQCHGVGFSMLNYDDRKKWGVSSIEAYGSDFIYDEKSGRWKYLHEFVGSDFHSNLDNTNVGNDAYAKYCAHFPAPGQDGWESAKEFDFYKDAPIIYGPPRSDLGPGYYGYSTLQWRQKQLAPPEPYKTMDAENTYLDPSKKLNRELFYLDPADDTWKCSWKTDEEGRFTRG